MEDYYEYLDSNGVTTLYKLIKDDTVALIDSYSVTINGITTTLDTHINNSDIHTPISDIENMVDTKIAGLVNSAPETLDTLKELSDALGNDHNFATTVVNQIGNKADKDTVYTKLETDTLLEDKANKSDLSTVATSGSYKDLLDKPVIPEGADLSDYYNKGDTDNLLNSKANTSDLAVVAKSGNYSDLVNTPTIPTKVSDLTNDSGYITSVSWEDVTSKPELSQVAISGSYSDLSGTPTIPTRTSQLINDSGFLTSSSGVITSVSWSDITNKPNFATVATSGSYNDLSNKPTIPNVYNKTLTIQKNGTKVATFTSNSNTDVTANITVPTKVSELSNDSGFITGISWDKVTNKPTLATVATSGSYTDLSNTPTIPTKVSQLENDTGFINALTDVVDTKSNQTINGNKTFTKNVHCYSLKHLTDNDYFYISGGSDWNKGANLFLFGISLTDGYAGAFELVARNATETRLLTGYPNGTLTWGGKNVALDENLVHKSGDETINGTKKFTSDIDRKYTAVDITKTPTSDMYAHFNFTDKNDKTVAYIQYAQKSNGVDYIGLRVRDKNSNTWGVQLNTNKEFVPFGNNSYSLGSSSYKWADAYIDRVICTRFTHSVNNGYVYIAGGSEWDKGANLVLHGEESSDAGAFIINCRDKTRSLYLVARPDGTLQWAGQDIATTAWVRTYVNSVGGSGSVGASISAYYSNATTLTAEGNSTNGSYVYPADYSDYINIAPTAGTIYTGSQLFSSFTPTASGTIFRPPTGSGGTAPYLTTAKATANFSGAFSSSAKYLCTTANAVRFRAYVSQGTSGSMGSPSVVDNSSAKSIFIRVQ